MTAKTNQQWRLASIPQGDIKSSDFEWREEPVPELQDGQFLARTIYLSIDPANRIWISGRRSYIDPVKVGDLMLGGTLSVVEESRHPDFAVGDLVSAAFGWQRYAISDGAGAMKLPTLPVPLTTYMSVLNHIGATAYFGLVEIGQPKSGETVVVSGAAGAVGSLVGQIAKIHGCRVVGTAGSDEKCRWLTDELGFDGAINYKTEDVNARLQELCPDGIDVYFDNVGGEILDIVLTQINERARIPLCGLISTYNATEPVPGPYNYSRILMQRARVEGFIVLDYFPRFAEAFEKLGGWMAEGKLKARIDLVDGLENALDALKSLFTGANIGKLAVKVSDEPEA